MNYYHAHPAIGIQRVPEERMSDFFAFTDKELGTSWSLLSDDEKDYREQNFFKWLIRFLSKGSAARFVADLPIKEDVAQIRRLAASRKDHLKMDGSVLSGPLSDEFIDALVKCNPVQFEIEAEGIVRLELHDGWTGVRVRLEHSELPSLLDGLLR